MEKHIEYSKLIEQKIMEMFHKDSANHIRLDSLMNEDNMKSFIHALTTITPCKIYNKLCEQNINHETFNAAALQLINEFKNKS